jgi:hypothetical protein
VSSRWQRDKFGRPEHHTVASKTKELRALACKWEPDDRLKAVIDGGLAHLSLWTGEEKVNYLKTGPMVSGETRDLGWEVYPAWMVSEDVPGVIAAALLFARERTLDPSLTWEFQDLG